jgi:hypothetical protein
MNKANRILFGGVVISLVASNALAGPPAVSQVRPGGSTGNVPVLTVQGGKVYKGASTYGPTQYTIDKNMIREGSTGFGRVIATVDGKGNVHEGYGTYGQTIATVRNGRIQEGASGSGLTIGTTDGGNVSGAAGAAYLLRD